MVGKVGGGGEATFVAVRGSDHQDFIEAYPC